MIRAALILTMWGTGAAALTLDLPPPAQKVETVSQSGAVAFPTGAWSDGASMEQVEGRVTKTAWRLPGRSRTVQQILAPARDALLEAGYEVTYDCADTACGGFDFRFALDLLPPPSMYVDLGNFRYVFARGADGAVVSLVASRAEASGYLHVTEVLPSGVEPVQAIAVEAVPVVAAGPIWDTLRASGRAVLDDLVFATGSSALTDGPFASLQTLADGLRTDPAARITLVGHSDTEGGLAPNMALSRKRAQSVRQALIDGYDIAPARIAAEGVAYLAPRASNETQAGREANRRVEVVLTPD